MHGETVKINSNIFHAYTFCDAHKIFYPSLYFYGGT